MPEDVEILSGNSKLDSYLNNLPLGLKEHLLRASNKAKELAYIHGLDSEKAGLSGLCHDIARVMKDDELYSRAIEYNIEIHPVEDKIRMLLHGPVGAEILSREFEISDSEILEAIWWHSTFNRGLGPIAKVTYLADKLDPNKASRFNDMTDKQNLAEKNLDQAILTFLEEEISSMISSGRQIHPASIEGRNWLLELLN